MEAREALTVRVPADLVARARKVKTGRESFNELVIAALEREVVRRQALAAHNTVVRVREQVRARTGPHPDPAPLLRALRTGEGRRG